MNPRSTTTNGAPKAAPLPPRPRLVLQVGVAGRQELAADGSVLYAREVSHPG